MGKIKSKDGKKEKDVKAENREESSVEVDENGIITDERKNSDVSPDDVKQTEETESRDNDNPDVFLEIRSMVEERDAVIEEQALKVREYEDLLKRKQADFENYRKRAQRELEDFRKYANSEIILDILNIIDDFERAIQYAESSRDFGTLLEGIRLVEKQLKTVLQNKYGVETVETAGTPFDPMVHDAIMMEESGEYKEDTVVETFQQGYTLNERVIRPAKVKVAKGVSPVEEDGDEAREDVSSNNGEDKSSEKGD